MYVHVLLKQMNNPNMNLTIQYGLNAGQVEDRNKKERTKPVAVGGVGKQCYSRSGSNNFSITARESFLPSCTGDLQLNRNV